MALENFSLGEIPPRQLFLLFGIILFAGCYFAYTWLISDLSATVDRQEANIQQLQGRIQQLQMVEAQLPQFKAEVEEQRKKLQQFRANLPSEKETPVLMERIQRLARRQNLRIKTFTPQQVVARDFYGDWPIQISMEGNFHNLGTFFEQVSQLARLVNIGDLTIRALEEPPNRNRTIAATCTATTFVYSEDGAS